MPTVTTDAIALSNVLAELALRQLPCGGWAALASSSQPAIEPTCYAALALGSAPVAADATCARLMGFDPDRIVHIHESSKFLGNSSPPRIEQAGETVTAPTKPFQVVPEFRHLYAL